MGLTVITNMITGMGTAPNMCTDHTAIMITDILPSSRCAIRCGMWGVMIPVLAAADRNSRNAMAMRGAEVDARQLLRALAHKGQ